MTRTLVYERQTQRVLVSRVRVHTSQIVAQVHTTVHVRAYSVASTPQVHLRVAHPKHAGENHKKTTFEVIVVLVHICDLGPDGPNVPVKLGFGGMPHDGRHRVP